MKKFFLLLMVVTIITTSSFAQTFSDLPDGHWAKKAVEEMVNAGIISGYTDGTFRPSAELSKIHSLLLLARIAGIRENTSAANEYANTYSSTLSKYSTQYKTDIAYLLGTGVLKESDLPDLIADNKINEGLTREEMAILVTKVLGKDSEANSNSLIILSFDDASSISAKAKPYVHFVNSKGYMNGVDDKNFAPKMILTRAQAASVFHRIYKLVDVAPSTSTQAPSATGKTSILTGTITKFDTTKKTVSVEGSDGKTNSYTYDTNTEFYVGANKKTANAMAKKAKISATVINGTYISVMNISDGANIETEDITGTISSFNTSKKTITISKNSKTYTYEYDTNTKFTLDGKSSTSSKALVKKYEITATIEDDEYITVAKVKKPVETITGKIVDASKTYGYVIIEDDDEYEYILMDDYLDEYDDDDEDYYYDDDTTFTYNGSSKTYSSISSNSYLYNEGYYIEITLDSDDYITKLKVASSKSNLTSSSSSSAEIDDGFVYGYIVDYDDDYLEVEDDDGEIYIFEIESDCVIIERSSTDPEGDLYYYDEDYDDVLDVDDEVVVFACDEDDGDYYTSLIILLD